MIIFKIIHGPNSSFEVQNKAIGTVLLQKN
jgi:hypothetical protein